VVLSGWQRVALRVLEGDVHILATHDMPALVADPGQQ